MKKIKHKYAHWLEYPVVIDTSREYLKKYIILDNPGYPIQDYRFYPSIRLLDLREGYDAIPSDIQVFYAWQIHNTVSAITNNKKKNRSRKKRRLNLDIKRFRIMYNKDKIYTIHNSIVRNDCIRLIKEGSELKKDDKNIEMYLRNFENFIRHICLDSDEYNELSCKKFVEIYNELIHYIFNKINKGYINDSNMKLLYHELCMLKIIIDNNIEYGGM